MGINVKNRCSDGSLKLRLLCAQDDVEDEPIIHAVDDGKTKAKQKGKTARVHASGKRIQTLCAADNVDDICVYESKSEKERSNEKETVGLYDDDFEHANRDDGSAPRRTRIPGLDRQRWVRRRVGQPDVATAAQRTTVKSADLETDALKKSILKGYGSVDGNGICVLRKSPDEIKRAEFACCTSAVSPLFQEEQRTSLFPIKHVDIWEMYKKAVASFWTIDDIDMSMDASEWQFLNEREQYYISRVLIFFLGADRLVNENLLERFTQDVKMFECLYFYQFQMAIENIHTETYNILIETFIADEHKREALFKSVEDYSSIVAKYDWCRRWTRDDSLSFGHRLVAFACVEGIFFSSSFAAIFWLKKRGILRGLCFSNEMISRDEGLHCDFAVLLFKKYCPPIPIHEVRTIVSESCSIEKMFVRESVPSGLTDINDEKMCAYVDYISERLMLDLTGERLYPHTRLPRNPLYFMENITLQGKTNFFERKVSEYRVAGNHVLY